MSSKMIETARALAAVWTGPALVQHVVSGLPAFTCKRCNKFRINNIACEHCGKPGPARESWPNRVTVPDLTSDANGGPLLCALGKLCPGRPADLQPGDEWRALLVHPDLGGWRVFVEDCRRGARDETHEVVASVHDEHAAHALALVILAVCR